MLWEMVVVAALTLLLLFLFVRELLPIPITALLAIVVLASTGILTTAEAFSGFSSQATLAILAMFVLSAGVQATGVIQDLTQWFLRVAGKGTRRQLIAVGLTAGPLSGIVNNTPVVAVLIPAIKDMARRVGKPASLFLIPLSFVSMLGGMLTLIGTSTSLLGNALLPRLGVQPFGFFEFTIFGVIGLTIGILYLVLFGPALLPKGIKDDDVEPLDLKGFIAEYEVPEGCESANRSLTELKLVFGRGIQVIRIRRGDRFIDAPNRYVRIEEGDQIMMEGSRETLQVTSQSLGLVPLPEKEFPLDLEDDESMTTAEVVITTGSRYVGRTIGEVDFRQRYEAIVIAVRHQGRMEIGPLAKSRLQPGDVLLVKSTRRALERMREKPDLYVTRERNPQEFRREKAPLAIGILAAVVTVAALGLVDVAVAALGGGILMTATGILKLEEFLESIQWDVVLLLAGVIPLGLALERVGLTEYAAAGIANVGLIMPPLAFLMFLFIATSLLTELLSNSAAIVLTLPIAVSSAIAVGLDAREAALVVLFAASTSMLSPIGYQTNTMVYSQGGYQFKDFIKVGGPLNLILAVVIPTAIHYLDW